MGSRWEGMRAETAVPPVLLFSLSLPSSLPPSLFPSFFQGPCPSCIFSPSRRPRNGSEVQRFSPVMKARDFAVGSTSLPVSPQTLWSCETIECKV
eukprot:3619823-Rhodomonas_salina.1